VHDRRGGRRRLLTTTVINLSGASLTEVALIGNGFTIVSLCIFYGSYILIATISGGITGLLLAFAYNLSARMVGGLEIELDREKGKRRDEIYE
jgi:hypothetical protein